MESSQSEIQVQDLGLTTDGAEPPAEGKRGDESHNGSSNQMCATGQNGPSLPNAVLSQDGEIAEQMLLLQNMADGFEPMKGQRVPEETSYSDEERTDEELAEESSECSFDGEESFEEGEIESDDDFGEDKAVIESISIFEYQEDKLVEKGQVALQGLAEKVEKCSKCDRQFASMEALNSHMKSHADGQQKYPCKYCGKEFQFQVLYKEHLKIHDNKTFFMCSLCGKRFANRWYLSQHERFHQGRYRCNKCSHFFVTKQSLQNHMRLHLSSMPRKRGRPRKIISEVLGSGLVLYKCHICSKTFSSMPLLSRHKRIHREQSFKCEICDKEFNAFSYLKQHLKVHDKTRSCMCQYCGKTFLGPWYCKRHELTHTEAPALKCRYCHVAFATLSNYKRHLRKHTGEKPFICSHCGKGFAENGTLQRHERTHTGVKPYECQTCNKRFTVAHALKRHEKTHSSQRTFHCKLCTKSFYDKGSLQRHSKVHEQVVESLEIPAGGLQIVEHDSGGNMIEILTGVKNMQDINTADLTGKLEHPEEDLEVVEKPEGLQIELGTEANIEQHPAVTQDGNLLSGNVVTSQFVQQVQLQDGRNVYATVFEKGTLGNWQVHVHGKSSESK